LVSFAKNKVHIDIYEYRLHW